jgi:hypothetical protein
MPPLFACLTAWCPVTWFANTDGVCRGCGERGLRVRPKGWSPNGEPRDVRPPREDD